MCRYHSKICFVFIYIISGMQLLYSFNFYIFIYIPEWSKNEKSLINFVCITILLVGHNFLNFFFFILHLFCAPFFPPLFLLSQGFCASFFVVDVDLSLHYGFLSQFVTETWCSNFNGFMYLVLNLCELGTFLFHTL